jgi:hypothetical protein
VNFQLNVQGMDKTMETAVKDTYFFITMETDHHVTVIQLVSFLEYTHLSSG